MTQPQGTMEIRVLAKFKGRQALERLEEVVCKALTDCEHIEPISGSVHVEETRVSKARYWLRRAKNTEAKNTEWDKTKTWRAVRKVILYITGVMIFLKLLKANYEVFRFFEEILRGLK